MIKEIPVKIQKYLKMRKIQLTFKVNYISLVKKDTIFRGLSDKPKTHSIRWHATMKRELLCTSRRARAFPTYTTRPFYVVRQSFVDKFRVSELRSTNSKDELWDQRPCTMTIWVALTSGTDKTKTIQYWSVDVYCNWQRGICFMIWFLHFSIFAVPKILAVALAEKWQLWYMDNIVNQP